MNTLLVFTLLVAACVADVSHIVDKEAHSVILEQTQDALPDGSFQYGYKTDNGIIAGAQGLPNGEIQGSYAYPDTNGQLVQVNWKAGPDGFVAEGPTIPQPSEAIVRSLAYNAAHPYKEPISP